MKAKALLFTPITPMRQQLTIELKADWREQYDELKDSVLDVTIKKHREKRSLNANAYMWTLINRIAEATGLPDEDVYRDQVREVGVRETIELSERAAVLLENTWAAQGIAWFTERINETADSVIMCLYYGSSVYNTAQMSRLIDAVIQDAQQLGIETLPPNEINKMKCLWG